MCSIKYLKIMKFGCHDYALAPNLIYKANLFGEVVQLVFFHKCLNNAAQIFECHSWINYYYVPL